MASERVEVSPFAPQLNSTQLEQFVGAPPDYITSIAGTISMEALKQIFVRLGNCEGSLLRQDEEIETLKYVNEELKQKMLQFENVSCSHKEEINNLRFSLEVKDKEVRGLKEEVNKLRALELKTVVRGLKEDVMELKKNLLQSDNKHIMNNNEQSGGARAVVKQTITSRRTVAHGNTQKIFTWKCNVTECEVGQLTYSPPFDCHPGGSSWKLRLHKLLSDKRIILTLEPVVVAHRGNVTFNVDVGIIDVNNTMKEITSKQIVYKGGCERIGNISESDYQAFITNNILSISITWTCQHN